MYIAVCPTSYLQLVIIPKIAYSDPYSALTTGEFCKLKQNKSLKYLLSDHNKIS